MTTAQAEHGKVVVMIIRVNEDTFIEALINRLEQWTDDEDILALYEQYYTDLVYSGCFECGQELDIDIIVDNDYINYTSVYEEGDLDREEWITDDRILARHNGLVLVNPC